MAYLGYTVNYYSYGSPRAGTAQFSRFFNAAIKGTSLRGVFQDDPVPCVPFHWLDYEHVSTEVHFLACDGYIKYPTHKDDYPFLDVTNSLQHEKYPCVRDYLDEDQGII